jgi:hypothetical protein
MRVLTWLPHEVRDQLGALDVTALAEPAMPRPDVKRVMERVMDLAGADAPAADSGTPFGERPRSGRRPTRLLAAAAAVVVVAGLAVGLAVLTRSDGDQTGSKPAGSAALYGVSWTDVASGATVVFAAHSAHTSDGCESRTQRLTVSRDHLRLGRQIGMASVCGGTPAVTPGRPGYAEFHRQQVALDRFYAVLGTSAAWSTSGSVLTLTAPSGVSVRLTTKGSAPLSLPGSEWTLLDVITAEPRALADALSGPTLSFDDHGGFRATDSRDTLTGTVHIAGDRVSFRTLTRTHREATATTKDQLIATVDMMLDSTITFQIEHNHLLLQKSHGAGGELIYFPAPAR